MTYKEAKKEYQQKCEERLQKIRKAADDVLKEVKQASNDSYARAKKLDLEDNEAPCSVCKKSEFVLKFRDVNGKIKGKTSGYFSLFGGSISGYIDGSIQTAPVLSCRNCENERKIVLREWSSEQKVWKYTLPTIWNSGLFKDSEASDWLKEKGVEVALVAHREFFIIEDYHDIELYSLKTLASVGLVEKYPMPKKPKWYQFIFN